MFSPWWRSRLPQALKPRPNGDTCCHARHAHHNRHTIPGSQDVGRKTAHATVKTTAGKPASKAAVAEPAATPAWIKLPPGVPKVVHGPVKAPLSLRFEDVKVGTGALGESNKVWHVKYTGWRAADGVK